MTEEVPKINRANWTKLKQPNNKDYTEVQEALDHFVFKGPRLL